MTPIPHDLVIRGIVMLGYFSFQTSPNRSQSGAMRTGRPRSQGFFRASWSQRN